MLKLRARILALFAEAKHQKSPEAEADLILFHVFREANPALNNLNELRMLSPTASPEIISEALRVVRERIKGIPLQHILGEQFFYEHEYRVNGSTLIPRPETEILVHEVLEWIEKKHGVRAFKFAELGIGSGIISAEILAKFPNAFGVASEVSPLACALAQQNLSNIVGADFENRLAILQVSDPRVGFEIFVEHASFDLIISNPPYVSKKDEIEKEVWNYEPHLALFPEVSAPGENRASAADENPNFFYENFLQHASQILAEKGAVFMEVPHERAPDILSNFQARGFKSTRLIPDLTGRHRVLQAEF